jgi:hypothetical protein
MYKASFFKKYIQGRMSDVPIPSRDALLFLFKPDPRIHSTTYSTGHNHIYNLQPHFDWTTIEDVQRVNQFSTEERKIAGLPSTNNFGTRIIAYYKLPANGVTMPYVLPTAIT